MFANLKVLSEFMINKKTAMEITKQKFRAG